LPAGEALKREARHTLESATGKDFSNGDCHLLDIDTTEVPGSQAESGPSFHDYLLAEMRCASLRARILQHEIDAVGIALKGGAISADQALELMHDIDLLRLIGERRDDE
jgi:hypothetical protein